MTSASELEALRSPDAISPLPSDLSPGLMATCFFGFLSALMTIGLIARLVYKLVKQRSARFYHSQLLWLLFNLVFADCIQAFAFLLSATWLGRNAITVDTPECWTQGWLLSTGTVASGVFTLYIACHTFADIICGYQLSQKAFASSTIIAWVFVYTIAIIGVTSHGHDFYTRAGAWCWINTKYEHDRLYLHYLWILVSEFGTMIVYGILFISLHRGHVHRSYHAIPGTATRVRRAAKAITLYPLVYIICTLPIAVARISGMAGHAVGYIQQCIAGTMLASTGWLDVLMYCITRHALIFGDEDSSADMRALDTFDWGPEEFGTRTIIEAVPRRRRWRRGLASGRSLSGLVELSAHDGLEDLHPSEIRMVITTHTEVHVSTTGRS